MESFQGQEGNKADSSETFKPASSPQREPPRQQKQVGQANAQETEPQRASLMPIAPKLTSSSQSPNGQRGGNASTATDNNNNNSGGISSKPPIGSPEWHRLRRESHKEVERRRRETINEGITELANLIPGAERNKGRILQQAVSYIRQLKETEASNIEKWTLEKLLTEQAINQLSAQVDSQKRKIEELKEDNKKLFQENLKLCGKSKDSKHEENTPGSPLKKHRAN
ncbi:basic helix-loop-helix protein [Mycoemilia scoparia]|uniref:Basic helix-loop-helix protein n=1 Tax=Mycoemilia scoparia TaxID=417184 RepID=A0A9W8DR87_9FUNG|nr:basic helix-loop-helix protein [Mycoemilia scoparia]